MELDQAEKCKSRQKSEKIAKGSFRERKKSLEDEIFVRVEIPSLLPELGAKVAIPSWNSSISGQKWQTKPSQVGWDVPPHFPPQKLNRVGCSQCSNSNTASGRSP